MSDRRLMGGYSNINSHLVCSVNTLATTFPTAAPMGAPLLKVANAIVRRTLPSSNECARIPKLAGTLAAEPRP